MVPPIASMKPRAMARPSPVPARLLVAGPHPVEFVEDAFAVLFRQAGAFIQQPAIRTAGAFAPRPDGDGGAGGAYFAALSSRLNSTCSNSTGSSRSIGRPGSSSSAT